MTVMVAMQWTTLLNLSCIIEELLDFADCRNLAAVCRELNHCFSTHPRRLTHKRSLAPRSVVVPTFDLYDVGDVEVPFRFTTLFQIQEYDFTAVQLTVLPNYFRFMFGERLVTSVADLEQAFTSVRPEEDTWTLVGNDDRRLVLEYPKGADIFWQTKAAMQSMGKLDVCDVTCSWFTCDVVEVYGTHVVVNFPWWAKHYGHSQQRLTYRFAYPSVFVAPPGTQAYDWRHGVGPGSKLRYKLGNRVVAVTIVLRYQDGSLKGTMEDISGVLVNLHVDDSCLGPVSHDFARESALSIPRLPLVTDGKRTRIIVEKQTRYQRPQIVVV